MFELFPNRPHEDGRHRASRGAYPSIFRRGRSGAPECHNSPVARLLLIDDDPAVSLTLSRMLEFRGHHVTRIESAETG